MSGKATVPRVDPRLQHDYPTPSVDSILHDITPDLEAWREYVRTSSSSGFIRSASGVSVSEAETEFAGLQRKLSDVSEESQWWSVDYDAGCGGSIDTGKAAIRCLALGDGPFGLESTLRGNKAADDEAGIRPKHIGVIWRGLTVTGAGGVKNFVKTFPDAFVSFVNVFESAASVLGFGKKDHDLRILTGFRGVAKPGEMVLVLGRPGSGCTTFLKVIANQRFGYSTVTGDVMYGLFDAETFAKRYRGEATYNQENDVHHATLTAGQTLRFALDTKIPGKRPYGVSKDEFKDEVTATLLRMFNIEHTRDTIVGDSFVRGISGGEQKRVSIAEMMVTSATVCAWDNSTRGLDSSTALDYVKSLRIWTNIYKTTTFVSLYQASENIYEQFDKVLVIDGGLQVFFGLAREARSYFEGLGFKGKRRQTTPDFLTGCTDEFEREYGDGYSAENAPHDSHSLAEAFSKSKYARLLDQEMADYLRTIEREKQSHEDFCIAVSESKRRGVSKKSVYSIPYHLQVWALMQRQFLLKWQDKFSLWVSWVTSLVISIMFGTVWLNLPQTSGGAFTRGGLFFIGLLFNALQAFGELDSTMLGRPIVNKHRAYTFHRPSALWLAQIAVDLAFAAAQIMMFSIIVYLMCGLVRDVGAFFTFYIAIVSVYVAMMLFFRTVGCLCPDLDYAIKFAAIILSLLVLTNGYLIQEQSEKVWLRWIYWINSLGLGFAILMENEFSRISLTCTAESVVPLGPGYDDAASQVCTLPGSSTGTNVIAGSDYVKSRFSYNPGDLWRNFGIIFLITTALLFANIALSEYITFRTGENEAKVYVKPNEDRKRLNKALIERRDRKRYSRDAQGPKLRIASKAILTWERLNYVVPTPAGKLKLLNDVYGYVKPGELTALMGASGSGKTTLLDVLAARKTTGVITGDILVDGIKPSIAFQGGISYAEQLDVHEPTQTVREALRFSADLRQPIDVPQTEKYAYVEEILSLLEMEDLADAIIGEIGAGLSVEQRKRVTIGVELAAKPELLLFLDEPTSGLDSQSAFNIIRFLNKLAAAGQAILCTIHQPNAALFENFDRLLLLERGGRCVYFGEIGKDAGVLLDYFRRHGAELPVDANPAEAVLDAIGAGQAPGVGDRDWANIFAESPEFTNIKEQISQMKSARLEAVRGHVETDAREFATPLMHQLRIVQKRAHLSLWRSPNYGFTRLFNHVALSLLTGLCFLNLDDSRASLQYRVFIAFQVTVVPELILAQVQPRYSMSRMIFYREASSKMYSQFAFVSSLVVAELPYSILCAVVFYVSIYYPPGFQPAPDRAGYQFLIILITELFSVTLGQMMAALTPSPRISVTLNPFILITFAIFCGVTIPYPQIPVFWRWLYQLNPFTRLIGGMVVTELHHRSVTCSEPELNWFNAPPGQSCGDYMAPFFAAGGNGYLADNATSACAYCAYKVGDQFYQPLGFQFENRWRDLGILAVFVGSNLLFLFLGSRCLNFNRR